ncbi:hypothetical protein ZWY2020_010600 [Hordeum vulgare]|nr:hypothetical protein ZWY2020_010600 [Hordeum vulgare]
MIWLKDVRELSYDMENCVDLAEPGWVRTMSGFKARVKEANERYDNCMLGSIPIVCSNAATDFQIPMVYPTLPFIRLHDGLFVDLCKWLTDDHVALKVASILGVGGIGKTTLAKQLWREHKRHFDCCAFVRTAKKPDMRRFLRSILAQVRPDQPPATNEVHQLIHRLRTHLQGKRLSEGNGSRIITTTEIKDVALACCRYQSKYIYKMEPLSTSHSEELFVGAVFGSGEEKSRQLDDVSKEMIRRCAGLPMAIISISSVLASQGEANTIQYRKQIQNILPTNATPVEVLKQVLIFCYKCLPSHLQTCLLYLSLYPENYIILKEDIVKQWVAEGFILAPREDKTEVAGNYFDKLVNMGLIQRIDVGYSNDVYYYAVHPMAHNLITSKSREENFMTVIDYSERTIGFPNKVSRLSLSLAVPNMQLDQRYRTIAHLCTSGNDTVHLPDLTRGPKHLETLEINARVAAIPANIVHIRAEVPDLTGTLKIVSTLNPTVSLDDSIYSPDLVKSMKTMELLSPICGIPKWTGQLTNLCILKFVLHKLPFLTVLSLHVLRPATGLLGFAPGGFTALEHFEFRCGVLRLRFPKGTIPNLQRLKLGFNAHRGEEYGDSFVGIQDLSSVQEISGMIGSAAGAVERDLEAAGPQKQHEILENTRRHQVNKQDFRQKVTGYRVVGQLGGQVDVEWQLPVWCPKLQELEISNCPEFSPLIPISWIESLHRVKIRRVKMLQEFTYSKSFVGVKLKITGKADLHSIDQVLVFDKETGLEKLTLERCPPLESKHLLMLTSLKTLIVKDSVGLVGPLGGGQSDVEWQLPVEYICIEGLDGNVGKELTELLRHLPRLSKLNIRSCKNIKKLVVGVDVQQTTLEASDMGGGEITAAAEEEDDGMLLFPPHLCDSLLELEFRYCQELVLVDLPTLVPGGGALQALRSLQSLTIWRSPKFLSTFSFSCHIFPSSLQFLRLWEVEGMGTLGPLKPHLSHPDYNCKVVERI